MTSKSQPWWRKHPDPALAYAEQERTVMPFEEPDTVCPKPRTCPLSRVKVGMAVRIKQLFAPPDVSQRLREVGLGEEQVVKLLISQSNLICQVCNARLAVSAQLAQMIFVEPLSTER